MIRATTVVRRAELGRRITTDTVTLDREARYRRRIVMESDRGHRFLLDLPEATYLAHGDALELANGALIRIQAAPEELMEVHAPDPLALARIAWHIGNRHTPAEITAEAIYIKPDHVLAQMVEGLGAHVHCVTRPFEPEGGAYGSKGPLHASHHAQGHHSHGHHHGSSHTHDHGDTHDHGPGHSHHHRAHDADGDPPRAGGDAA